MTSSTKRQKADGALWPQGVGWRISATHLLLLFEAVWPRLWPATGIAGGFLLLALWDIWLFVPGLVHLAALIGFCLWFLYALWQNFSGFRFPSRNMALRRLERDNHFDHRPLSTYIDAPAFSDKDKTSRALWLHHQSQLARLIASVRLHAPRSDLPARDPHALRALLLLLLLPSFYVAGSDWREQITAALSPDFSWSLPAAPSAEAWIDPPDYTGVAPMFLTSQTRTAAPTGPIEIPASSLLVARTAEEGAELRLRSSAGSLPWISVEDHNKTARLEVSQRLELIQSGRTIGRWDFNVIADRPPAITLTKPLMSTVRKALEIPFAARDDYGVEEASIQITLTDTKAKFTASEILSLPLSLPARSPKRVDETTYHDLTAHPWAGLPVTVQLVALDAIGQIGRSEPLEMRLPERAFLHPLAKAIIEQRRNLALSPKSWDEVALALDALALLSPEVAQDYTLFLGLRSAYWSLVSRQPEKMSQITDVYGLLWDLALRLEEGDAAAAEQNLRVAQKALMDALAKGASSSELDRLMQAYNSALGDYLKTLAERAMSQDRQTPAGSGPPANAKQLRAEDLQNLLQNVRDMIATGDTAGARDLLADLQRMMENLATGKPVPMTPEQARLTEAVGELSNILNRQRSLLDETYSRRSTGMQPGEVDEETLPGVDETPAPAASSGGATPLQRLAPGQRNLADQLEGLTNEISQLAPGAEGLDGLEDAIEAMGDAAENLAGNFGAAAEDNQRSAIEAMSQGANDLANQLMQQAGSASQDQRGQSEDPLGRTPGAATSLGDTVKVPNERDLQRARDILEELQKRASETGRSTIELQYLERLLKRF